MLRTRLGLGVAACAAALACMSGAAQAAGCSYTWTGAGGDGSWGNPANWTPAGVPGTDANHATESVCITAPGTYTVTLVPFADNGTGYPAGVQIGSLTLGGGASGTQTLEIEGEASVDRNNETTNDVDLDLAAGTSQIASSGELILDGTALGTGAAGNGPDGAGAWLTEENTPANPVSVVNAGTILSESDTSSLPTGQQWENYLGGPTVVNDGEIQVQSGTLGVPSPNNSGFGNSNSITLSNAGTFTVSSGATFNLSAVTAFNDPGSFVNSGTTNLFGSATWNQGSVNSMSGNLVQVQGGGQVVDSSPSAGQAAQAVTAGSGGFQYIVGGGYLAGVVPAGQTIDVQGTTYNCSGNQCQTTQLTLGGPNNTYPGAVVNNGTVRLDADGSSTTTGGAAILYGDEFDNNATFESTAEDTKYSNQLLDTFVNEPGGTATVTGGTLLQPSATATTNRGTTSVAPGATWVVQGGSFTNDGTFAPQISSSSVGTLTMRGSLAGPGTFNAGGTLAPSLESYTPAAGTEFPVIGLEGGAVSGTFGSVSGGFSADYSQETASPAFVGAKYGSAAPAAPPALAAGELAIGRLAGGPAKATLELSCPGGTSGCPAFAATASVTEKLRRGRVIAVAARAGRPTVTTKTIVVATASGTLTAGRAASYTLKLNAAGKALLARHKRLTARVTVTSGTTVIGTRTVTFTRPPAKHKKTKQK